MTPRDFHEALELPLMADHASRVHAVARIDGMLAALAALNDYVNHAAKLGFVEIDPTGGVAARLATMLPHVGAISLRPASPWFDAARAALTEIAVDDGAVRIGCPRPQLIVLVADVMHEIARLMAPEDGRAFHVVTDQRRGDGLFGYIRDGSMVLESGGHAYLLGLGWSD